MWGKEACAQLYLNHILRPQVDTTFNTRICPDHRCVLSSCVILCSVFLTVCPMGLCTRSTLLFSNPNSCIDSPPMPCHAAGWSQRESCLGVAALSNKTRSCASIPQQAVPNHQEVTTGCRVNATRDRISSLSGLSMQNSTPHANPVVKLTKALITQDRWINFVLQ